MNLGVPAGGRVALLGTNGAGKSTLMRVIAGLLAPTSGSVRLRGEDITALLDMVETGRLQAVIDDTFPLERATEALDRLEQRQVFGKLVVTP